MVLCGLQNPWLFNQVYSVGSLLHDSTGARAYMAGIYEKQEAIKVLILKEREERHDSRTSACYRQPLP